MRILLLHQYFLEQDDPGGSRFNEMTRVWVDEGHQVTVIAGMMHYSGSEKRPEYKGKYFVKKEQNGVQVIRCHVSESYNKSFRAGFGAISPLFFPGYGQGFLKQKVNLTRYWSRPRRYLSA